MLCFVKMMNSKTKTMNEQKLLALKKEIDDAKVEVSELTGEIKSLMKTLKDDWNCETLEDARKKIRQWEKEIAEYDEKIKQGVKELEEKYEFD